jgi:transcriptional regulator with XRE-family HTH domain
MSQEQTPPAVGKLLAERRQQRGLSLQSLAKISGVSKSMISQIENGQVNPTLAVVWKLATGLGIRLQDLLEGEVQSPESRFLMLTTENCPTLMSREHGYSIQILSSVDMVEKTELYLVEFEPSGVMHSEPHAAGTVETLTVVKGEVEVQLPGDQPYRLRGLESARYQADVSHAIKCKSPKGALVYLAVKFDWQRSVSLR